MILINNKEFSKIKFSDVEKFLSSYDKEESFFIELKNNDVTTKDLIKEICAFSNTFGGYLFLGIEDDKKITGCHDWTEEKINNAIRNLMSPTPIFDVKKLLKNSLKIFVIKIEEGTMPPYITNKGVIYERISSSSFPIKDSFAISRMLEKRKDNIKKIENKIYIPAINENVNNLCGYLDFGFSVSFRNQQIVTNKIFNANFEEISKILKKNLDKNYSISKVGYSICISIGNPKMDNNYNMLVPAGIDNFLEILPDGSVRGRIVLPSLSESNIVSISSIVSIVYIFRDIYSSILKKDYCKNFIEARCYQKLTVLKIFEPKFVTSEDDEYFEKIEQYYYKHKEKYGSNIIVSNNRIPLNGFYLIDKAGFEERKIKYNEKNLFDQLFRNYYVMLGYIDSFDLDEKESREN